MISKNKKSIAYAIFGHIYEHYENSLFSFVASFLSSVFFSNAADNSSRIGIYIAVAAGFVMRPFGAILFSWVGDTYGRKKALIYSVTLCVIPSTLIGVLPTYAAIGMWSSVILVVARLLQGISVGGGFYATLTFVSESSSKSQKNLFLGITLSMGFFGAILGTLCSSYFMSDQFPEWGWRIPFLIGGIYGVLLFVLKYSVNETEEWKKAEHSHAKMPFIEALGQYSGNIFAIFLLGAGLLVPFYLVASWLPGHINDTFRLSTTHNLLISSLLMLTSGITIFLFAWLTTWIRPKIMIKTSCVLGFIGFFLLQEAIHTNHYALILFTQFYVAIYTGVQSSAGIILIQKLFPVKYKFSGFAIPFSLGQATLMGSTPLLSELIAQYTGSISNVSYLILLASSLVFAASFIAKPISD